MHTDLRQQQSVLNRTRTLVSKIQTGRGEGDQFMTGYFLPRRSAYSIVMAELNDLANAAPRLRPRRASFIIEPVEGSDTVEMMQIAANYEGNYQDLIQFVNLIDKSDRLLVVESLNADSAARRRPAERHAEAGHFCHRGRRIEMNLKPSNLGAEPKKIAILVALVAVAAYFYFSGRAVRF